jgi:hypothetical protein
MVMPVDEGVITLDMARRLAAASPAKPPMMIT